MYATGLWRKKMDDATASNLALYVDMDLSYRMFELERMKNIRQADIIKACKRALKKIKEAA